MSLDTILCSFGPKGMAYTWRGCFCRCPPPPPRGRRSPPPPHWGPRVELIQLGRSSRAGGLCVRLWTDRPLIEKSRALCHSGRSLSSFIDQVIIITGFKKLNNYMFSPRDGLRCRQGVKPPLKLKLCSFYGFYLPALKISSCYKFLLYTPIEAPYIPIGVYAPRRLMSE